MSLLILHLIIMGTGSSSEKTCGGVQLKSSCLRHFYQIMCTFIIVYTMINVQNAKNRFASRNSEAVYESASVVINQEPKMIFIFTDQNL